MVFGMVLLVLACSVVVADALGVRGGTLPRSLAIPGWLDPTGQDPDPAVDAAAERADAARAAPQPDVGEAPALTPSERRQAVLVDAEDKRVSRIVSNHHSRRVPFVVPGAAGVLPTEVLTPRTRSYDLPALVDLGAVVRLPDGAWLLTRSLLVVSGARLHVQAPGEVLRLSSGPDGFASVISFKSAMAFEGGPGAPLTITSWDPATSAPDTEPVNGRAYLRAVGSRMDLTDVHLSDVGFWSGRTGGLAWTGATGAPATGSVTGAVVERSHYGVFSLRSTALAVTDSVLRGNDVDGLLARRYTTGLLVRGVTTSDNGRNGVSIADGAAHVTLTGGVSTGNGEDGIRIDGRSRPGAPPAAVGTSYAVTGCRVAGNQDVGIVVTGADGVTVIENRVSGGRGGIAVQGVTGTPQVTANIVDAADVAVSVRGGPAGSNATVAGNRIGTALTGMEVHDASADVHDNLVTGATRYAVSLVGQVAGTRVATNTLGGHGLSALDVVRVAPGVAPELDGNDVSGWTKDVDYVLYAGDYVTAHPLALLWTLILVIPFVTRLRTLRRRRAPDAEPGHPDRHSGPDVEVLPPEPAAVDTTARLPVTKVTIVSQVRDDVRLGGARGGSR